MRLLCTITDEQTNENPYAFSYFLKSHQIPNECEEVSSADGKVAYRIWIYEEDDVEPAKNYYEKYHASPLDPQFRSIDWESIKKTEEIEEQEPKPPSTSRVHRQRFLSPAPYGFLTICILLLSALLFIWGGFQGGIKSPPKIPGVFEAPLFPRIDQKLLFDYPKYFSLRDELLKNMSTNEKEKGLPLTEEASSILQEMQKTPFWSGFYDRFIAYIKNKKNPLLPKTPWFEKIQKGEVWRLLTPAFLHFDLLHIFFNVLWFIMLGNQIEYRLGTIRYALLILLTALASNVAQYLISGSFFMGLSGIICGMAAFIWARQQKTPWEGYLLHRMTLLFLGLFVIGMFFLQVVFFILQLTGTYQANLPIANTAHIVGGIIGYLCGRLRFFSIRHKR